MSSLSATPGATSTASTRGATSTASTLCNRLICFIHCNSSSSNNIFSILPILQLRRNQLHRLQRDQLHWRPAATAAAGPVATRPAATEPAASAAAGPVATRPAATEPAASAAAGPDATAATASAAEPARALAPIFLAPPRQQAPAHPRDLTPKSGNRRDAWTRDYRYVMSMNSTIC